MRRVNATRTRWLCALLLVGVSLVTHAQVYRCTAADGRIAYQDQPCPRGQAQKIIDVPNRPPPGYVPPAVATTVASIAASASLPPPVYAAAPLPLPVMYACVGAVNGKRYLTRHPPPPYLAPLGVMGYPPQTLSQAYGAPGGAGMSAPELAPKPRVGGPPIAARMTEVQDYCAPAPRIEVCAFVQHEYDENHSKLRIAMRHEQPPLERRAQQLGDELRNCR